MDFTIFRFRGGILGKHVGAFAAGNGFAALLALSISSASAVAATRTWDGGNNSDTWDTTNDTKNNWDPNTIFNSGDSAIFAGTTRLTPTIGASSLSVGSITFNNTAGAFTIGGSATLTIGAGVTSGAVVTNSDDSVQTFSVSTIALSGSQTWNAGSVAGGKLVFSGSTLSLGSNQTLTVDGANNTDIGNAIVGTGTSGITKTGTGTLTLTGTNTNTYVGRTTVSGGTLLLGAADRIDNTSPMTLAGGTFATGGHNETLGALTLSANSIIDMGAAGASTLHFGASSGLFASGTTLSIYNWTASTDHVFFGSDSSSLTTDQLSQIHFFSGSNTGSLGAAKFGSAGEIVAVPEPSTVAMAFGLAGLAGWRERRRTRAVRGAERRAF